MIKNLVLFKAGWLACVLGAAHGLAWVGAVAVAAIALEHLRTALVPAREALVLLAAGAIGLLWESALVAFELLRYDAGIFSPGLAPYWIVAMWVLFATTLNIGLQWVKRHWLLAASAGAVGGPMAFFGGERFGAVVFADTTLSLIVIGIGWALLLPVLALIAERYNGHGPTPLPAQASRRADERESDAQRRMELAS